MTDLYEKLSMPEGSTDLYEAMADPVGPPDALLQEGAMLQDENDAMSTVGRIAAGMGRGIETDIRGVQEGIPFTEPPARDPRVEASYGDLSERYPVSTTFGEIAGEALPFAVGAAGAGRLLERAGASLLKRLGAQGAIGATEGGVIAAGRDQDVTYGAVLGGSMAMGMEFIAPYLYRAGSALYRAVKGRNPSQPVITEAGEFSAEIMEAAEEAGITPDELIDEVIDLAQASAPQMSATPQATQGEIEDVLKTMGGEAKLADTVNPDPQIMSSAESLGLEEVIPASALSQNRAFQETEQALKAMPESGLGQAEDVFVSRLKEEADKTITMFEGTLDKGALNQAVREQFDATDDKLFNMANMQYDRIAEAIPPTTMVSTGNTEGYILDLLNNYGGPEKGERFLSTAEKQVLSIVGGEDELTYAALDRVRKNVGAAIGRKEGPFKDEEVAGLKKLYEALTLDQESVAAFMNVAEEFDAARSLTKQRKDLEDRMVDLFGKNLDQSMIQKLESGVDAMGRGDMMKLKKMMDALPEGRRGEAAASLLNRMFTSGGRNQAQLSQGFVGFYERLNRSPKVKEFFFDYLPDDAEQRMDAIFDVAKGFYRATNFENKSNTARTALLNFEKGGWVDRLYSAGAKAGPAEVAAAAVGIPPGIVTVATGVLEGGLKRDTRTQAADKLLRSPKFRDALRAAAQGNKAKEADDAVRGIKVFREWLEYQPPGVATEIAAAGFIPWLLKGEEDGAAE